MDGGLREVASAVAAALPRAPWALSDVDVIEGVEVLQAVASMVAAVQLALVRELDGRGLPVREGASSTRVWLRDRLRISIGAAGRLVRLAQSLDDTVPVAREALAAGQVNVEQAAQIAAAVAELPASAGSAVVAEAEALLVEYAAELDPAGLRVAGARILAHVAPELADEHERRQLEAGERRAHERRFLSLVSDGSGGVRLRGLLDEEGAASVRAALDPLCRPTGDGRTPDQRKADALVDVCARVLAGGELPDSGGEAPRVVVTVDYDALTQTLGAGTLDTGVRLSPEAVRLTACAAGVLPVVLDGAGQVLDVGRERRLFTGSLRRALVARDGGCSFPGCARPPQWTVGHHVLSWAFGGPTSLDNGVLLCRFHHHVIHSGEWSVRIAADGLPEFIPPAWLDPLQRPRRNRRTHHSKKDP